MLRARRLRLLERRYPKPAPPPPGMMYEGRSLVSVQEIHDWSRRIMRHYDEMSPEARALAQQGRL